MSEKKEEIETWEKKLKDLKQECKKIEKDIDSFKKLVGKKDGLSLQ